MVVGFALAYQFVGPAPPKKFVIATGPETGAYIQFARQFSEVLSRHGIELEVRSSAGSIENLRHLRDPDSDIAVALVQSGVTEATDKDQIFALGSLYYEPVWVFYRGEKEINLISEFKGKRIGAGARGSGTQALTRRILDVANLSEGDTTLSYLDDQEAANSLKEGSIDAAFFITSAASSLIEELLTTEGIQLMHFRRAEAYSRRLPSLSRVTLPEGVIDMARGIPSRDIDLLAPNATLLCRENFHPALVDLLLQAASEVHEGRGLFEARGEFPSPDGVDFKLSPDARRYFKHGPPFLQQFLPFWAATLIDRLKIMLLPLVFLLLPFAKILPPLYKWKVRSRIYKWYEEVQLVDQKLHDPAESDLEEREAEIDAVEQEVLKVSVPLSYAQELYALRLHIALLREKIQSLRHVVKDAS